MKKAMLMMIKTRQCHRLSICTCQEIWYEGATNTATNLTWQIERRLPQPSVSVCRIFEWLGNFQKVTYQQNFDRLALLRTYNVTSVWFQSISSTFGGAGTTFVNSLLADWPGLVVSGEIFLPKWYCICPAHDICIWGTVRVGRAWRIIMLKYSFFSYVFFLSETGFYWVECII